MSKQSIGFRCKNLNTTNVAKISYLDNPQFLLLSYLFNQLFDSRGTYITGLTSKFIDLIKKAINNCDSSSDYPYHCNLNSTSDNNNNTFFHEEILDNDTQSIQSDTIPNNKIISSYLQHDSINTGYSHYIKSILKGKYILTGNLGITRQSNSSPNLLKLIIKLNDIDITDGSLTYNLRSIQYEDSFYFPYNFIIDIPNDDSILSLNLTLDKPEDSTEVDNLGSNLFLTKI